MRLSRRALLIGVVQLASAEDTRFSADVDVVTLLATVRNRDGAIVKDLTQDDFLLMDDGTPQKIRYFSRESDLALTIGLLVDTSRSQTGVLEPERDASYAFLDHMLRDKDRAFLVHFDTQVEVLQGLTSSRQELAAALQRLMIPGHYATLLYSAVRQASEDVMRKQSGRKAFILLSDGFAFRDHTSLENAIEFSQRADALIYSIRFSDHSPVYRPGRAAVQAVLTEHGKKVLERLSRETGGEYFEVSKTDPIEKIYGRIEDALRTQYSIGYSPEGRRTPGKYHKIKLSAKRPDLIVETRAGYYAK
jgi:VWFA-related protein